jgi:hypothetical protein
MEQPMNQETNTLEALRAKRLRALLMIPAAGVIAGLLAYLATRSENFAAVVGALSLAVACGVVLPTVVALGLRIASLTVGAGVK